MFLNNILLYSENVLSLIFKLNFKFKFYGLILVFIFNIIIFRNILYFKDLIKLFFINIILCDILKEYYSILKIL